MSGQHLLPDWLQKVLPSDELVITTRRVGRGEEKEYEKLPFREKTEVVCDPCNTRWMGDLENEAKPFLIPPIIRQPCRVDSTAQILMAKWALMTTLVFQAHRPASRIAPPAHYSYLRRLGVPSRQITIWLGSHVRARDDPVNSVYAHEPLALEPLDDEAEISQGMGYLSFLAVGGISFTLVGHSYRNQTEITCDRGIAEALIQVWPVQNAAINWPPPLMMDRDLMDALPGSMTVRIAP